jgi:uncharacterized OB-fold protein
MAPTTPHPRGIVRAARYVGFMGEGDCRGRLVVPATLMGGMANRPVPDVQSASFWEGLANHEVVVEHCNDCSLDFFPHLPTCPRCGGRNVVDRVVSGRGRAYSRIRVHRALSDEPAVQPPYAVGTIELDDGCRMFGRIEPHEAAAIGLEVSPRFIDHDGWTELAFQPSSS